MSENGKCCLDIGAASMKAECEASHESWATRLVIRRVDGPSKGPVSLCSHKVGIFSEKNGKRLDIGSASVRECAASHNSWATRLFIRPLDGSSQVQYNQLVGIFSESNGKRLDIGSASVYREIDASHSSWATRLHIHRAPAARGTPVHEPLLSTTLVKIVSENGKCCLDIGAASMKAECEASHESWATRLVIRRVDGPSKGPVSLCSHKVGIFSEKNGKRLDIGSASVRECAASHNSWATRLFIRPLDGSSQVQYNQLVGIFSESKGKRLDIGSASVYREIDASYSSWTARLYIQPIHH